MFRRLMLAATLLLACSCNAAAQWKPLVVISFSGWEKCHSDLQFLGQLIQNPQLAATLGQTLAAISGVRDLNGLDISRPWAVIVRTDGLHMQAVAAVPTSDVRQFLEALSPVIGEPRQESPGVWKIGRRTLTGFVREQGGWAYVAQTADAFEEPLDVLAALGEMPVHYDLAATVYPANLPEALRTLGIDEVRNQRNSLLMGLMDAGERLPGPLAKWSFDSTEEFLTDVEQLTIGWKLDRALNRGALEVRIRPRPGTDVARRWSLTQPATSALATQRDPAATSFDLSLTTLPRTDYGRLCQEQLLPLLEVHTAPKPWQRQPLTVLCSALGDLLADASQQRPAEALVRVYGNGPPYTVVAGLRLRDADLVPQKLERLAAASADSRDSPVLLKRDAVRNDDLRIHELTLVGMDEGPLARRLLGEDRTLRIATNGSYVWLARGPGSLAAIQNSQPRQAVKQVEAVELTMHAGAALTAWARSTHQQDHMSLLTLISRSLQASDDRIELIAKTNNEGLRARVECHEGVLRAVALGLNLLALQSQQKATRPVQSPSVR